MEITLVLLRDSACVEGFVIFVFKICHLGHDYGVFPNDLQHSLFSLMVGTGHGKTKKHIMASAFRDN